MKNRKFASINLSKKNRLNFDLQKNFLYLSMKMFYQSITL